MVMQIKLIVVVVVVGRWLVPLKLMVIPLCDQTCKYISNLRVFNKQQQQQQQPLLLHPNREFYIFSIANEKKR